MMIEFYGISASGKPLKFKDKVIGYISDSYWIKEKGDFRSHCIVDEKYKHLFDLTKEYTIILKEEELFVQEKEEKK